MISQNRDRFWLRLSIATFLISIPAILFSLYIILQGTVPTHEPCSSAPPSEMRLEMTFREQKKLENISSSMDESWSSMLSTPKGGFLWRPYNETMNEAWGVTMFHSIHCLGLIRGFVQGRLDMTNSKHKQDHGHSGDDVGHIGHCFSYIAQSILCAGDDTIEPPWRKFDVDRSVIDAGVNGEGVSHMCRDTRLMWETVLRSESHPVAPWKWHAGDTIRSIFGEDRKPML